MTHHHVENRMDEDGNPKDFSAEIKMQNFLKQFTWTNGEEEGARQVLKENPSMILGTWRPS